ncbi:MAG: M15 family metallopeptidase [Lachnospiraceae bacterium]|nr:M15 family metallopeptidase [Lachnospiraceae bacterium]
MGIKKRQKTGKQKRENTERKKKRWRVWAAAGLFFLALILYFGYVIVYRQMVEPKTDAAETTTDPVLYTVTEQMEVLRPFEELYRLAFEGRAIEDEYGMIAIPGLEATETLTSNQDGEIEMCTSMTPQGLAIANDYLLISAYCHTHRHNSVVYVLNKNSRELVKVIVLKNKDHVGGLAFDKKNYMIWVSTSHDGRAAASAFSLRNLEAYNLELMKKPIAYTHDYDLYTLERDSFMTYADGYLYIGHFSQNEISVVQKFEIGINGGLKTRSGAELGIDKDIAMPDDIKKIPKMIQGFAVYEDKVILTQSYGIYPSFLLVHNYDDVMHRTQKKYTINKITLPQKLEQIYIDGTDLYILFESAAYAYSAQPLPKVDRVLKLQLSEVIKVDINDLMSEKNAIKAEEDEYNTEETYLNVQNPRIFADFCAEQIQFIKNKEKEMKRVQDMPAGAIVTEEQLKLEGVDNLFYAEEISDEVFARMEGKTYKENCTVPREELRYVRVLHFGFDGKTHVGELVVNEKIADTTVEIFRELYNISYPIEKMHLIDDYDANDEASMADNNCSAFNFRTISFTNRLSNHARGMAIDINPLYNPYIKTVEGRLNCEPVNAWEYTDRQKEFDYKIDHEDPCYQIFTQHGFSWGGDWTDRKDYQHFEMLEE